MPAGKLRSRAGIESLAYVAESENELTLAAKAAQEALGAASCGTQELDWIVTTSETHHDYPSLSAQLHSRLLVRENCGALDVGGACLGLLNALVFAQSLIGSGQAQTVAVVTADVHSRTLTPGRVAGEFGGLFGDGASAFILRSAAGNDSNEGYRLGDSSSVARASTLPPSRSAIRRMAASPYSSTAKPFLARRSPAWKKLSHPSSCAAASRAAPSAVLRRTNRTLASCPARQAVRRFPQHFSAGRPSIRQSRLVHVRRGPA